MQGQSLIAGLVIALVASTLSIADFIVKEGPHAGGTDVVQEPVAPSGSDAVASVPASAATSSQGTFVKKGTSTKKASGVNVESVFDALLLTPVQTSEAGFLALTSPNAGVKTMVLLKNNDRAFLLSWVESDNVKTIFSGLKQALQEQFSGKVTDLIDETRTSPNGPPVDILSFSDPALSPEPVLFLRVRNRLYELHIAENGTSIVEQLVAELSK